MLRIVFYKKDDVYYGPGYFKYNYDLDWLSDPLVQEMMKDIDKSEYKGGYLIESKALGPISPETLSGGLKTLISIYKEPDKIFDATSCGDNCAKWLVEIGKKQDITVNLSYLMLFDNIDPLEIYIVNTDQTVHSYNEYVMNAVDILEGGNED